MVMQRWKDADGNVIKVRDADPDTGIVTVYDGDGQVVSTEPMDPTELETIQQLDRERAQRVRIEQTLSDLKNAPRLIPSEHRFDTSTNPDVDLREMAKQINDLRSGVKDLIRLVRNLDADE